MDSSNSWATYPSRWSKTIYQSEQSEGIVRNFHEDATNNLEAEEKENKTLAHLSIYNLSFTIEGGIIYLVLAIRVHQIQYFYRVVLKPTVVLVEG